MGHLSCAIDWLTSLNTAENNNAPGCGCYPFRYRDRSNPGYDESGFVTTFTPLHYSDWSIREQEQRGQQDKAQGFICSKEYLNLN